MNLIIPVSKFYSMASGTRSKTKRSKQTKITSDAEYEDALDDGRTNNGRAAAQLQAFDADVIEKVEGGLSDSDGFDLM